jgi:hypothetical protein
MEPISKLLGLQAHTNIFTDVKRSSLMPQRKNYIKLVLLNVPFDSIL